jgi:hypothetical protein
MSALTWTGVTHPASCADSALRNLPTSDDRLREGLFTTAYDMNLADFVRVTIYNFASLTSHRTSHVMNTSELRTRIASVVFMMTISFDALAAA